MADSSHSSKSNDVAKEDGKGTHSIPPFEIDLVDQYFFY